MKVLMYVLWLVAIFAGPVISDTMPDRFHYIIGFMAGSFALMFLTLARHM